MSTRPVDTDAYLNRIGLSGPVSQDLEGLTRLQYTHLTAVPFENLHVFAGLAVRTDAEWSVTKIVEHRRGGWCFENNGAFAALLEALGFDVIRLGAAVLLNGPTKVIDHLALEVQLDQPYLVDVGFGRSFIRPLALNQAGPQDGGSGTFEFLQSTQGLTLTEHEDGVPAARYRFKRVAHRLADFDAISDHLQADRSLHWSAAPFATRLLGSGADRVTLTDTLLRISRDGHLSETQIASDAWEGTLRQWFDMEMPPNPA